MGLLTVDGHAAADLTKPGTKIGEPDKLRSERPFCVQVDCVSPACKFILDTNNAEQHQAEDHSAQAAADRSAFQKSNTCRCYTFVISAADDPDYELKTVTVSYDATKAVHKKLHGAGLSLGFSFRATSWIRTSQIQSQTGHSEQTTSGATSRKCFTTKMQCLTMCSRLTSGSTLMTWPASTVVSRTQALERAVNFLGITGEVLRLHAEAGSVLVFLRPQLLVDVVAKALVEA